MGNSCNKDSWIVNEECLQESINEGVKMLVKMVLKEIKNGAQDPYILSYSRTVDGKVYESSIYDKQFEDALNSRFITLAKEGKCEQLIAVVNPGIITIFKNSSL